MRFLQQYTRCFALLGVFAAGAIFTLLLQYGEEQHHLVSMTYSMLKNNIDDRRHSEGHLKDTRKTDNRMIQSRFKERKNLLQKICTNPKYPQLNSTKYPVVPKVFNRLLYCGIPKTGTTFTAYTLPQLLKQSYNGSLPSPFNGVEKKSYVVVREPYSRLLSGYLGKIVTNQPWWVKYGKLIVRTFRANASENMKNCGNDASFAEFVKYVIRANQNNWHRDQHWSPMSWQCAICNFDYDYIVHLETMKDDLQHIFTSVNVTLKMDLSDEEATMRSKCSQIVDQRPATIKCEDACVTLGKVWWSFKARGLIAENAPFPLKGEQCNTITGEEFADIAWNTHLQTLPYINKKQQKRDALVKLFLSVPLQDRLTFQDLYRKDFELFGYDPQPPDLFPELVKVTHSN